MLSAILSSALPCFYSLGNQCFQRDGILQPPISQKTHTKHKSLKTKGFQGLGGDKRDRTADLLNAMVSVGGRGAEIIAGMDSFGRNGDDLQVESAVLCKRFLGVLGQI